MHVCTCASEPIGQKSALSIVLQVLSTLFFEKKLDQVQVLMLVQHIHFTT